MGKREDIEQLKGAVLTLTQRVDTLGTQVTQLLAEAAKKKVIVPEVSWEVGKVPKPSTPPDIKHFEQKAHQPKINDHTKPPRIITAQPPWIITAEEVAPRPYAHPNCED
jgi:hypothetical protein